MDRVRAANTTFLLLCEILFECLGAGSMAALAGGGREASYHRTNSSAHAEPTCTFMWQGLHYGRQGLHSSQQGLYSGPQGLYSGLQGLYSSIILAHRGCIVAHRGSILAYRSCISSHRTCISTHRSVF